MVLVMTVEVPHMANIMTWFARVGILSLHMLFTAIPAASQIITHGLALSVVNIMRVRMKTIRGVLLAMEVVAMMIPTITVVFAGIKVILNQNILAIVHMANQNNTIARIKCDKCS